jgi:hypothetical protein
MTEPDDLVPLERHGNHPFYQKPALPSLAGRLKLVAAACFALQLCGFAQPDMNTRSPIAAVAQ